MARPRINGALLAAGFDMHFVKPLKVDLLLTVLAELESDDQSGIKA